MPESQIDIGVSILELDDTLLVANRMRAFRDDLRFRESCDIDFKKYADLYESRSDDTDEDGIPRVNMMRRAVEDHVSVATTNVPKARLVPSVAPDYGDVTPIEQQAMVKASQESQRTINSLVQSILTDNDYVDEQEHALRQAGIFGVGYLQVDLDQSADTRKSLELRDLFEKGPANWTPTDARRFKSLTRRIRVRHINTPGVLWQDGIRRFGDDMNRVTMVEHRDVNVLRAVYGNEDIKPGTGEFAIDDDATNQSKTTGLMTTWERVPLVKTHTMGEADPETGEVMDPVSVTITDWVLIKTVIAGGQLLDREVTESTNGSIRLPIIPQYLRESEMHPYGVALPAMLELSERFINRVRTLMYQSALKSISPQAVIGVIPNMGLDDESRIKEVLYKGGFANVSGNDHNGRVDIRDLIQPVISNNPGVQTALIQAMQNEERAFLAQSQQLDLESINRAESGAAKRAQIAALDRPKTITLNMMSKAVEYMYDSIFEIIRTSYRDEDTPVTIYGPQGNREQAVLNRPYERDVPMVDGKGEFVRGQDGGLETVHISLVLNDVSMIMKAEAEGRSEMPMDMVGRFMLFAEFAAAQLFKSPETLRELVLNDKLRAKDDMLFAEAQQAQQQAQQQAEQQQLLQQAQGGDGQGGLPAGPEAPEPVLPTRSPAERPSAPQSQSLTLEDRGNDGLL